MTNDERVSHESFRVFSNEFRSDEPESLIHFESVKNAAISAIITIVDSFWFKSLLKRRISWINWGASFRWSSCLFCPMRNSDKLTIEKMHPLYFRAFYLWKFFCKFSSFDASIDKNCGTYWRSWIHQKRWRRPSITVSEYHVATRWSNC